MSDTLCPRCTAADARQLRRATLRLCARHQHEQAGAVRRARRLLKTVARDNPTFSTRVARRHAEEE